MNDCNTNVINGSVTSLTIQHIFGVDFLTYLFHFNCLITAPSVLHSW
jgi:hypothetical protein